VKEVNPSSLEMGRLPAPTSWTKDDESIDFAGLAATLAKRWLLIVSIIGIGIGLTVLFLSLVKPQYRAEASLMLDLRKLQASTIESAVSAPPPDTFLVKSQIDLLRTPEISRKVIERLDLARDPAFNPAVLPPEQRGWWYRAKTTVKSNVDDFLHTRLGMPSGLIAQAERVPTMEDLVSQLRSHLVISGEEKSYVLTVQFSWEDPVVAARIANAVAQIYVDEQLGYKQEAALRATKWLEGQVGELRSRVQDADQAVQAFREQNQITATQSGSTINGQQISEVNTQLVLARADGLSGKPHLNRHVSN
jgi:polysaccharide biosynthesis transport protein